MNTNGYGGVARRMIAAGVLVPLCLAMAACSGPGQGGGAANAEGKTPSNAAATVCKAPDFQGPYAAEFKLNWEQSKTELGKRILEDCRVTDAELTEVFDAQNKCLAPYGLVSTKGQLSQVRASSLSKDEMNQKNTECAAETDLWNVESMYDALQSNPDNLDVGARQRAIYQCLKQRGLLPKPITEQEFLDLEVTGAEGLSEEQIVEKTRKWNEFYRVYMERNDDGSPNPDYDAAKAKQFWECQTDALSQQ
ncbi:hypothetical protein EMO92_05080 [Bifidobacterium reuteri]|uniref:Lipoprotein n=1 Tax=Bifidobacterium reuteri TaxID=983706 RepID=A0A5J5E8T2_9BIFI|nr:hypothetical protein [Bifidobacterium reuteri]KAA8825612.1 hypothetical protein EMO92_05080 [Bifidobacterium reuteri]